MSSRIQSWLAKHPFLFGFVVGVGCVFAALRHPWVRGELHEVVARAIRDELGLNADLGPVRFEFPFRIVATKIRLDHPQHGPLARAERLVIEPSLTDLLFGQLELTRVQIEGARVRLVLREGRVVNLPRFDLSEDADPSARIPLEELILRQSELELDAYPHGDARLEQVSLLLRVADGVHLQGKLEARGGHLKHVLGEETIERLRLYGRFSPDALHVRSLNLSSSFVQLEVNDFKAGLPLEHGRYAGRVKVSGDLERLTSLPHGLDLPELSGRAGFEGQVDGAGGGWHAQGTLRGDDVVVADFGTGALELKVDLSPDELRVLEGSAGRIVQDGGRVLLRGRLGFDKGLPLELDVKVVRLELHKLMDQLHVTKDSVARWELEGGFRLAGTCAPLDLAGPIEARHKVYRTLDGPWHDPTSREVIGTGPGRLVGRVTVRPDALRFERLIGTLAHSTLRVDLALGFGDWMELHASSENLDLRDAPHLAGMDIQGRGRFSLHVVGPYSYPHPQLTGHLKLANFALAGYRIGDIDGAAQMERAGRAVRFEDVKVVKGGSQYVIDDLLMDFTRHFQLQASGRLGSLQLADFYHTVGVDEDEDFAPYQADVAGTANVSYSRGAPGDAAGGTLVAEVDLDLRKATVQGLAFGRGKLAGVWRWREIDRGSEGGRLELKQLHLRKGRGSLHARGRMDYGGKLKMTVDAHNLPLANTEPIAQALPGAGGVYSVLARLGGTLRVPRVHADVNLAGVSYNDQALGDARLYVRLTDRDDPWVVAAAGWSEDAPPAGERCARARMGLASASWAASPTPAGQLPPLAYLVCGGGLDDHVRLDLALGVAPGLPARGLVELRDLPAATLFPRRHRRQAPIEGALRGTLDLRGGGLEDPDSLVGRLHLSHVRLGQAGNYLQNDGPIRLALTPRGFHVERAAFEAGGSALTLQGSGSLSHGLAMAAQGDVDLGALAGFVGEVEQSAGHVALDMKVTGKLEAPNVYGEALLHDGALKLASLEHMFSSVDGRVTFSANQVLIEDFRARVAGGRVQIHGAAALRGSRLGRYELFVSGKDLNLRPMDGVQLTLGGNAKLAWADGQRLPQLTGTLRLERARYTRAFRLNLTDTLTGLTAQREESERYDPELDRVAIDVRLVENKPIRISNSLIDAQVRIEDSEEPFRVVGTDQRLGVLGTLDIPRGVFRFRNTEFNIESGRVVFEDRNRIRPRFDLVARTEIRRTGELSGPRWSIALHAKGDSEQLSLETSSEPSLSQEDIALLLTVGMTRAEAQRLQGGLGSSAALEALATVSGVDREVRRALPVIDDFSVSSAYSVRTNRTEPQITVGKQLSERVRAEATTGLGEDANFRTGVEWRLNDQASVEASYDNVQTTTSSQFGNVGVDLRWRLEFD